MVRSNADSRSWRDHFIRTLVERDMPQLGINIPSRTLRRFWSMLSHYHGQVWNASEFARAFGVSLLVIRGNKRYGFEIKRTSAPRVTPSMRSALTDLQLTRLDVLHAGSESFPLAPKVRAIAAKNLFSDLQPLPR